MEFLVQMRNSVGTNFSSQSKFHLIPQLNGVFFGNDNKAHCHREMSLTAWTSMLSDKSSRHSISTIVLRVVRLKLRVYANACCISSQKKAHSVYLASASFARVESFNFFQERILRKANNNNSFVPSKRMGLKIGFTHLWVSFHWLCTFIHHLEEVEMRLITLLTHLYELCNDTNYLLTIFRNCFPPINDALGHSPLARMFNIRHMFYRRTFITFHILKWIFAAAQKRSRVEESRCSIMARLDEWLNIKNRMYDVASIHIFWS